MMCIVNMHCEIIMDSLSAISAVATAAVDDYDDDDERRWLLSVRHWLRVVSKLQSVSVASTCRLLHVCAKQRTLYWTTSTPQWHTTARTRDSAPLFSICQLHGIARQTRLHASVASSLTRTRLCF